MVQGKGHSYNLNNKFDAIQLCQTLNTYEQNTKINTEKLKQQIIALQMDLSNTQNDLNKIKKELNI